MWIDGNACTYLRYNTWVDYTQLLKKYINVLAHEGASDLHLSSGAHPTIRVS